MAMGYVQRNAIRERILLYGGPGCLQGDAEIVVNRAGNGVRRRLADIVHMFNGGTMGNKKWDPDIPTFIQREIQGRVRLVRLLNAWSSGIKETFTVTTSTGRSLRATAEHPFLTERGWLRLDELGVGDLVHVRGERTRGTTKAKIRYREVYRMQAHPYAVHKKNGAAVVPEHRLVVEAARNNLSFEVFCAKIEDCEASRLEMEFLDPAVWAVHHDDENPLKNELSNLVVLTHSAHRKLHAERGGTDNVQLPITHESIASIKRWGREETFDLEVEDDPHNFIANGFVVHNCGKSTAIATIVLHTPNVHHYIVDNEIDNYERIFAEDEMFKPVLERGNYTVYPVDSQDWDEQLHATREAGEKATPGDWVYFDMITDTWEAVQRWFTMSIFDADLSDYFMRVRKDMEEHNEKAKDDRQLKERKNLSPFEGFTDWSVINPEYKKLYAVFMRTRGHVGIVAEEDVLRKDEDDKIKATFGGINRKPKGQKKLGHVPHTVIHLSKNQRDEWHMNGVKDRGRELADGVQFDDFAKTYFVKYAKWKMVKVEDA